MSDWLRDPPKRPWRCWTCGHSFSTGYRLMQHKDEAHPAPVRPSVPKAESCGDCPRTYDTLAEVEMHRRAHHPRRLLTGVV